MTPTMDSSCAAVLTKANMTAKTLSQQQDKIRHYKKSKSKIKKNTNDSAQHISKLKQTIKSLELSALDTEKELKSLGDVLIKKVKKELDTNSDITSQLDPSIMTIKSLKPNDLFDLKPYKEQIDSMNNEIEILSNDKLDCIPHQQELHDLLHQTNQKLISNQIKIEREFDIALRQRETEAKLFEVDIKQWSSEENIQYLADKVLENIFYKQKSFKDNTKDQSDTEAIVQKTLNDYCGEKFIAEIIRDQPNNIYPSVVNSLQVRDTTTQPTKLTKSQPNRIKEKLTRLETESEETLSSLKEKLHSDSLIQMFNHLEHIELILGEHQKVLQFLNLPNGTPNINTYKGDVLDTKNIPPEIALYEQDVHITNALVATISQYTENLYFSDLARRLDTLEKELA